MVCCTIFLINRNSPCVSRKEKKREIEGLQFLDFIELNELLGLKAITYGRIDPCYNLILMNS